MHLWLFNPVVDLFVVQLGALAVFIRQTNVIWILFIAANAAIDLVEVISLKEHAQSGDSASPLMENDVVLNESRFKTKSKLRRRFQHSTKSVHPSISERSSDSLGHQLGFSYSRCNFLLDSCRFLHAIYE